MDDEKIYQQGGTDHDIEQYAKQNGADDFLPKSIEEKVREFEKENPVDPFYGMRLVEENAAEWLRKALQEIYTQGKSDATQDILKLSERGPKDSIFDRIVPTIDIENYAKKLEN